MKLTVPTLLSFAAGYIDTAGFMALNGLFTAHVTGNFVTIGAALVLGTSGVVTKLLALPTFCAVVILARLLRYRLVDGGKPVFRTLLAIQLALLVLGGAVAIVFGPFGRNDPQLAMLAGLSMVAGMAVQNALQRVHLGSAPPTTMMTGTTTQLMLDVADLLHGVPADQRAVARGRMARMGGAVLTFALGCAVAAVAYRFAGMGCFVVPPLLVLAALCHADTAGDA
jgi:uncharacterized membrane protein YoaK (UPF0700 family)